MTIPGAETSTDPTPHRPAPRRPGAVLTLAMLAFAGIGLNEATLGVAFPQVQESFDLSLDRLGLLLLPGTVGYLLVAVAQTRARRPWPVAWSLVGAAGLAAGGTAAYALSPVFAVMLVGSFLLGVSAAGVDTTLNNYVSVHLEPRVLAFMHGGFGVGAMAGPLVATALLGAGWSWRWAYAGFALFQAVLVVGWIGSRHRFAATAAAPAANPDPDLVAFEGDVAALPSPLVRDGERRDEPVPRSTRSRFLPTRRALILPLNVVMFFLYTGTEASTGLLLATLLVDRGFAAATAGLVTTAFWGAITAGRFATGFLGRRVAPYQALAGAVVGCVVGMVGLALGQGPLAVAAVILVGLSLAPVFPSLVAMTPARLGAARTHVAIAWQLAAASLGVAVVPAIIGVVAARRGPAVIGPCLLGVSIVLAGFHVLTASVAGDRCGRPERGGVGGAGPPAA